MTTSIYYLLTVLTQPTEAGAVSIDTSKQPNEKRKKDSYMNIGLIGQEKSGKTTIFNALTGQQAEVSDYTAAKPEPNRAVVDVVDERIDTLTEHYRPKKTTYATINVTDFIGIGKGETTNSLFSGEGMNLIKTSHSLAVVLRNFSNPVIDDLYGEADPLTDLEAIMSELILADQIVIEQRLERIAEDQRRGKKDRSHQQEEKILQRILSVFSGGSCGPLQDAELPKESWKSSQGSGEPRPESEKTSQGSGEPPRGIGIRTMDLNPDEKKVIAGFQFLTAKPLFAILNSGEENYGKNDRLLRRIGEVVPVIEFAGRLEAELMGLEEEEKAEFMADLEIIQSARSRLTTFAYEMLGYISFFTVGEDEVRSWTIRRGETGIDAAGAIHSDLARGFIRAECFSYEDLIALGDEKEIKKKGRLRLEGKDYPIKDGDILNIRFSV